MPRWDGRGRPRRGRLRLHPAAPTSCPWSRRPSGRRHERSAAQAMGGIRICERLVGSEISTVFFPVGAYRCPGRLALYPKHQKAGPHGPHWRLTELGVEILEMHEPEKVPEPDLSSSREEPRGRGRPSRAS